MSTDTNSRFNDWITGLIALFIISLLHVKGSYTAIPLLLSVVAIYLGIKKQEWIDWHSYRLFIYAILLYVFSFVLSFILHDDLLRELDSPSHTLLMIPILLVFKSAQLSHRILILTIIFTTLISGVIGLVETKIFSFEIPFTLHLSIQAGCFMASLAMFCLASSCYLWVNRSIYLSIYAQLALILGLVGTFLTTARTAWMALPFFGIFILMAYRKGLSKKFWIGLVGALILAGMLSQESITSRIDDSNNDVIQYNHNNSQTSLGARFDMWRSAILGIQEKPLLGWGAEGVKQMRKQHFEQGLISAYAASFDHAHNQYLHDFSARGILGITALLAIFLAPLYLFGQNLRLSVLTSLSYFWSVIGIGNVLATMIYCLSQSFFAHNSGLMFYFFITSILLLLSKPTQSK